MGRRENIAWLSPVEALDWLSPHLHQRINVFRFLVCKTAPAGRVGHEKPACMPPAGVLVFGKRDPGSSSITVCHGGIVSEPTSSAACLVGERRPPGTKDNGIQWVYNADSQHLVMLKDCRNGTNFTDVFQ